MSTSTKHPNTIRQGGPGSSDQNAKAPLDLRKPPADADNRNTAKVSGGGGERAITTPTIQPAKVAARRLIYREFNAPLSDNQ